MLPVPAMFLKVFLVFVLINFNLLVKFKFQIKFRQCLSICKVGKTSIQLTRLRLSLLCHPFLELEEICDIEEYSAQNFSGHLKTQFVLSDHES